VRYAAIVAQVGIFAVAFMCRVLEVAPSGYYASDYRALLKSHDITPSMSRKGDCWDNAVAESLFSSFGFELEFDANWRDVHDVERDAAEYIDGFYNPRRRHSHNSYLSPIDFEHQFMQQENAS
jgi:transposase InsO family protein